MAAVRSVDWRGAPAPLYRQLQTALFVCLVVHLIAPAAMLLLVVPGFDLGGSTVEARAAYVASFPWAWRLGWLPWQLSALSDVALSVALLRWVATTDRRAAQRYAWLALVATLIAVVPDQWGEWVLVTRHVDEARALGSSGVAGDPSRFLATEAWALLMTGTCGNDGYVLMTVLWAATLHVCAPSRGLTALTAAIAMAFLGSGFAASSAASAPGAYPNIAWTTPLSGLGFALLAPWLLLAAVAVARARGSDAPAVDRASHRFRWPAPGLAGRIASWLGDEHGLRDVLRPLPFTTLRSDISDVVYLNWLVPSERVASWLPEPLRLHRLAGDRTFVSLLTYRHGGFGPAWLGPLRKLLPSPRQSNWRLYLDRSDGDAIYFFRTVLSSPLHALGARLLSDGLPALLPARFEHRRDGDRIVSRIEPGAGSAPDLDSEVEEQAERELPREIAACFASWDEAVRYLVEQKAAVTVAPRLGAVVESAIHIPIALASVRPARVLRCESRALATVIAGSTPFAFVVPSVAFTARGERLRPIGSLAG